MGRVLLLLVGLAAAYGSTRGGESLSAFMHTGELNGLRIAGQVVPEGWAESLRGTGVFAMLFAIGYLITTNISCVIGLLFGTIVRPARQWFVAWIVLGTIAAGFAFGVWAAPFAHFGPNFIKWGADSHWLTLVAIDIPLGILLLKFALEALRNLWRFLRGEPVQEELAALGARIDTLGEDVRSLGDREVKVGIRGLQRSLNLLLERDGDAIHELLSNGLDGLFGKVKALQKSIDEMKSQKIGNVDHKQAA
jgi:hypothetical protein